MLIICKFHFQTEKGIYLILIVIGSLNCNRTSDRWVPQCWEGYNKVSSMTLALTPHRPLEQPVRFCGLPENGSPSTHKKDSQVQEAFVWAPPASHRPEAWWEFCNPPRHLAASEGIKLLRSESPGAEMDSAASLADTYLSHLPLPKTLGICTSLVYGGIDKVVRTLWSRLLSPEWSHWDTSVPFGEYQVLKIVVRTCSI